jgi:hypothetical protein
MKFETSSNAQWKAKQEAEDRARMRSGVTTSPHVAAPDEPPAFSRTKFLTKAQEARTEPVLYALEGALLRVSPLAVQLGDLMLTPTRLYFIPHAQFLSQGTGLVALATAFGGVVGGIATSLDQSGNLNTARSQARMARESLLGDDCLREAGAG